ncbi:anhydro-N-acetylmuramic acid kinase [Glaciecola petra]|uniref:Anhydro-N-acetylmuramic acid kinase n=1 Tax=Glaciecola petra TaxID=3075602 RepID=A0ABU2ZUL3_9ALTE|nr:anhydro-N-acetylmuramic acid kinase [Aestuariibacter sp. P117]MDT0596325.1 anhydro-N-acetylmuramic acid kinase [Aestuariibacter sp. P117]
MNKQLKRLLAMSEKPSRLIVGLMSGTSLDGLDIALCKVSGVNESSKLEVISFTTIAYDDSYRSRIVELFAKPNGRLIDVCTANNWVAKTHADMLMKCLKRWDTDPNEIDLIASHGQTIFHAPDNQTPSTLQIGDGDHIAQITNIITISDFRQKHVAAGGDGAPLVPYADYLLYKDPKQDRLLLNIGGIANFTLLPAACQFKDMICTDTGPGNTLMDAYVKRETNGHLQFDDRGAIALTGDVDYGLLQELKNTRFLTQNAPKSTGQELFNLSYVDQAVNHCKQMRYAEQLSLEITDKDLLREALHNKNQISFENVMATLNQFTADTISEEINTQLNSANIDPTKLHIYTSGGGPKNKVLMNNIAINLPECHFHHFEVLGLKADSKEAALFALLANQSIFGDTQVYKSANASHSDEIHSGPAVSLGKISLPN